MSVRTLTHGLDDALRLLAAMDGSLASQTDTLAGEYQRLLAEISGTDRAGGLREALLSLAWFACRELADQDDAGSAWRTAERIAAEITDRLSDARET